jgi:hypothetical protein
MKIRTSVRRIHRPEEKTAFSTLTIFGGETNPAAAGPKSGSDLSLWLNGNWILRGDRVEGAGRSLSTSEFSFGLHPLGPQLIGAINLK